MTHREIGKFTRKDAENYPKYEAMLERVRRCHRADAHADAAEPVRPRLGGPVAAGQARRGRSAKLGPAMGEAVEMLTGRRPPDPRSLVRVGAAEGDAGDRRHHRRLRRAVDARHGVRALPSRHGRDATASAASGATSAAAWAGSATRSPAAAKERASRSARTPRSRKILVKNGRAVGVALNDGDEIPRAAASPATPTRNVTFVKLMRPRRICPPDFVAGVKRIDYDSATLKINVALTELPNFTSPARHAGRARSIAARSTSARPWTTSSAPTTTPSTASRRRIPILECTIPSAVDPTRRARRAST